MNLIESKTTTILSSHRLQVADIAFSPNGKWFVTIGENRVIMHSIETLNPLKIFFVGSADYKACCAVFSPDNNIVAAGYCYGQITFWNRASGKKLPQSIWHDDSITHIVYSPCGKYLATAGRDRLVKIWGTQKYNCITNLTGFKKDITGCVFTADSKSVIVGREDGSITFWDLDENEYQEPFEGHETDVRHLHLSKDGTLLFSSGYGTDGIRIWNTKTRKLIDSIPSPGPGMRSLSVGRQKQRLCIGGSNGFLHILNRSRLTQVIEYCEEFQSNACSMALSPDNRFLIVDTVPTWNTETKPIGKITVIDFGAPDFGQSPSRTPLEQSLFC